MQGTDDNDDKGHEQHLQRKGLADMPAEVVQMIVRCLDAPRDLGVFAIAASHLAIDPVAPQVARLVGFERASEVLARGAPLPAVIDLFAEWDEPVAIHMLGDAAEGGRLDVVEWVYARVSDGMRDTEARHPMRTHHPMHCRRRTAPHSNRFYSDSCSSDSDEDDAGEVDAANPTPAGTAQPMDLSSSSSSWCSSYVLENCPKNKHADELLWVDALARAARKRHLDVVGWIVDGPCYGGAPVFRVRPFYHTVMIEAAARGHLDVLVALHRAVALGSGRRCQCPAEIGIAAVQADRPDVVAWLNSTECRGTPPLTPAAIGAAIVRGHRPRFIAWAAAQGYTADAACLVDLAQRDAVRTLALAHDTGLRACTPEAVRAAARAGSLNVLKWAASGDDDGGSAAAPRVGAAWRPTDVAMLAATNRRVDVIAWLRTRQDGQRALTVGVARAALAAGCVDAASHIRPFGTWDALEAAVASGNTETVRAVADAGGVCSPAAFVGAIRCGGSDVLAFLCDRYGVTFVEGALASLAGVPCAPACLDWLATHPATAHLCLAEAHAAILARGEVDTPGCCRCPVCAAP